MAKPISDGGQSSRSQPGGSLVSFEELENGPIPDLRKVLQLVENVFGAVVDVNLDVGSVHELHGEALSETSDEEGFDGEDGGDFVGQEGSLRLASVVGTQIWLQT